MELVIYFKSLVDNGNKGYFKRFRKIGFSSSYNVNGAKKFNNKRKIREVLNKLREKEGKYYNFKILEVLSNGKN